MKKYTVKFTADVYVTIVDGKVTTIHTGDEIIPTGDVWSGDDAEIRVLDEAEKAEAIQHAEAATWPVWDE